jgi:2-iminoacetate synthase ThiH
VPFRWRFIREHVYEPSCQSGIDDLRHCRVAADADNFIKAYWVTSRLSRAGSASLGADDLDGTIIEAHHHGGTLTEGDDVLRSGLIREAGRTRQRIRSTIHLKVSGLFKFRTAGALPRVISPQGSAPGGPIEILEIS